MAGPDKGRKTTIVDIAEASGVSVATVSRILNNKPDVAEETRERVLRVMDEIGFAPRNAWQQIRSGKSHQVAMHFPQDFNPPAHRIITAAALGVEDAGYSITIMTRSLSDADLLGILRSGRADAMILLEVLVDDRRAEVLRDAGYPFVMIGRRADNEGLSYVDVHIEHGIDLAMEHLAGLGHERIGLVTLDPVLGGRVYGFTTWAIQAYDQACARLGMRPARRVTSMELEEAEAVVRDLLSEEPAVTALIAPQEHAVVGVLKAAQSLGLRIPDELSVIGTLSESMSELATPPLTTVSFPADEMGGQAARILLEQLAGRRTTPRQVMITPELVIRGSTGVAPLRVAGVRAAR